MSPRIALFACRLRPLQLVPRRPTTSAGRIRVLLKLLVLAIYFPRLFPFPHVKGYCIWYLTSRSDSGSTESPEDDHQLRCIRRAAGRPLVLDQQTTTAVHAISCHESFPASPPDKPGFGLSAACRRRNSRKASPSPMDPMLSRRRLSHHQRCAHRRREWYVVPMFTPPFLSSFRGHVLDPFELPRRNKGSTPI